MRVLLLAGSPSPRSRSGLLLGQVEQLLQTHRVQTERLALRDFSPQALLWADFTAPSVQRWQQAVANADALVIASPVYKASVAGTVKTLLDVLPEHALAHKVVLPLATAGSKSHLLTLDYTLHPVLSALKAQEVLQGVFASDSDVPYPAADQSLQLDESLTLRLSQAVQQLVERLHTANRHIPAHVLAQQVKAAQLGI